MGRLRPGVTLEQANSALLPVSMPIVREGVPDADWIAEAEKTTFTLARSRDLAALPICAACSASR